MIAFACLAIVAACLTIDYGEHLTDEVARKMHGRTVHVPERGHHHDTKEIAAEEKV